MDAVNYINNYLAGYRNYKEYWNYEDGCVLMGCRALYYALGDRRYSDFVLNYLEPLIAGDGTIRNFPAGRYSLDSFCAGRALIFAYDQTREDIYRHAVFYLAQRLAEQPRTLEGSLWHKAIYPFQVWLDGFYMVYPFYMEYEQRFGGMKNAADIRSQFLTARRILYDSEKRLYRHGYDESGVQPWADSISKTSRGFWLRAMGWYLMALADIASLSDDAVYRQLFTEAAEGIIPYIDAETMLLHQVVDKPHMPGNYTETSGSAMVAYALMKFPSDIFAGIGVRIFNSLNQLKLIRRGEGFILTDICLSAGLGAENGRDGSDAYYISEKKVSDDPKGVGPFMMAYAQRAVLTKRFGEGWGKDDGKSK